jgi:NitT/TauT family transport system substrate-binding protein
MSTQRTRASLRVLIVAVFHVTRGEMFCVLLLAFVLVAPLSASAQTATQKITIAYPSRSIVSIDLFIAQDKGFFRDEGLTVELVQVRGNVSIAAALTGEIHAVAAIGTVVRAIQRSDVALKVLAVSLKRPLFWLVARPEYASVAALKGKVLGTTTFGGTQHLAAEHILRKGGLDPEKDVTVIVAGDVPAQLQSLATGVIQAAALSPPTVILARDKFKMRILGSAVEEFQSPQNGTAVSEKFLRDRPDVIRRILRARSKASRYFWEEEQGSSDVLAKYLQVDNRVAKESYKLSRSAFTSEGVLTDQEVREFLKSDAQILGLPKPVDAAKVFDFSLQRAVNQELRHR